MNIDDLNLTLATQQPYVFPYGINGGQLVSYNPGSSTLFVSDWSDIHYWRCRATMTGEVYLGCDTFPEILFWTAPAGIRWIRFTFDQNMNPVLLFKALLGDSLFLRYFNPVSSMFELLQLPPGTTSAALLLDDFQFIELSNIFVFYTKVDGVLYGKTQADLYTAEYVLVPDVNNEQVISVGMLPGRRLQLALGQLPWSGSTPEVSERIPRGTMKHVKASKFESEVIPIKISMLDRCIEGESIANCTVTCSVLAGEDPTPSAMISGTAVVTNGDYVTQEVIGGLPGVTYTLWYSARTTLDNIVVDTVTLVVLTDEAAVPEPLV